MTVLRRAIQKLGPYQSLALLLVPVTLVEPLKLVALVVAGEGHWLTGTAMIVGAYAVSLLVVERLFKVVKPKLMSLSWFARLWKWWVALRNKLNPWSIVPVDGDRDGCTIMTKHGMKEHPALRAELGCRAFITRNLQRLGLNLEDVKPVGRPLGPGARNDY